MPGGDPRRRARDADAPAHRARAQVDARRWRGGPSSTGSSRARASRLRRRGRCASRHLGEQIRAHVGDGARSGYRVRYSDEGPTLLGTGGALRLALAAARADLPRHLRRQLPALRLRGAARDLRAHPDCDGVMSVFKNEGSGTRPTLSHGRRVGRRATRRARSDPALRSHRLRRHRASPRGGRAELPAGASCGLDAVQRELAARRRLRAYAAHARFFEIGSPRGLPTLDATPS